MHAMSSEDYWHASAGRILVVSPLACSFAPYCCTSRIVASTPAAWQSMTLLNGMAMLSFQW